MAAEPVVWQEEGPVSSLDQGVDESVAQGETGAIVNHSCPSQDRKAPRAEPEEDIDVLESEAQDETLPNNQTLLRTETDDAAELENQESTRISLYNSKETRETLTELEQFARVSDASQTPKESGESIDQCEDALPPPPLLSALSTEEYFETEGYSSPEGEVAEWISDAEIISDPTEDLRSPDSQKSQERPQIHPLSELINKEVDPIPAEGTKDNMTPRKDGTQLNFLSDGFDKSEPENEMSGAAAAGINLSYYSLSDRNNSGDVFTLCSPPFADESEGEEEVNTDNMSGQHHCSTLDITGQPVEPSNTANISFCNDETTTLPAVLAVKQQRELSSQSQCELVPRVVNQEAAQQVLSQSSSPLSTVAMELSNQGGAVSQDSSCVVAVKERHNKAGGSQRTGGEEEQKDGGLDRNKVVGKQQGRELLKISKTVRIQELQTEKNRFVSSKHSRMDSDSCDDSQSDSGVSADFSPCSTSEGNTTNYTNTTAATPKETPIEREIRRAIEREHSLRRSRGLPSQPASPEYVEIPLRKTVLHQSLPAKSEQSQGKDRQFAGKKMQHEIHAEVQREQDLVKLGKVPGFYDKGTVRQLKERKLLFEAFQKPSDSTLTVSTRSRARSSASDISTLENEGDISSQASTIGGSQEERSHSQSPYSTTGGGSMSLTPRGPGFTEGTSCQVIILENNLSVPPMRLYNNKPETSQVTVVDSRRPHMSSSKTGGQVGIQGRGYEPEKEEEAEVAPKENPFFKLRPSTSLVKVEQDIREAQEREMELHKQRISLYGGKEGTKGGGGGRRPASIEVKSPMLSPSSLNEPVVPDLPGSSSREATEAPAARQSAGKFGVWPPAKAEEGKINRPESPRTPRQKNPLVQRWESGLVNGHNEEED